MNNLKNEFEKWFENIKQDNNKKYSEDTIKGYIRYLEKISEIFTNLELQEDNLFKIGNYEKFDLVNKKIRDDPDFEKINRKCGHGQLSAGLEKYREFLITRNSINKQEVIKSKKLSVNYYNKEIFLSEVFINEEEYEDLKSLLLRKKNIILQGPPGVGKTYAAKKLAFSIIGYKDESKVKSIQFHQSYSYEDFMMGYRPKEDKFSLEYGVFYNFCEKARKDKGNKYFFIIDEINRGNLSKIFGELLMLLEKDKREQKIHLAYGDIKFSVPENLYIIGTMNTADRSLAIIDYALRRRFSFFELEPAFEKQCFRDFLDSTEMDSDILNRMIGRLTNLNNTIEEDPNLGKGFKIGHSYFCDYKKDVNWYRNVIKYEIKPLLEEYWFDELDKAEQYIEELLR